MKKNSHNLHGVVRWGFLSALLGGALLVDASSASAATGYATVGTSLYRFDTAAPNGATLVGNTNLNFAGVDFNPANGQLYGFVVGTSAQLYTINITNGAATLVGSFPLTGTGNGTTTGPAANTYDLTGQSIGFDFNPKTLQTDGSIRIRVTAQNGSDLRLNSATGGIAAVDRRLNGAATSSVGSAYTNNRAQFAAAGTTTLYDVSENDTLYIQTPPNDGTLVTVGGLTIDAQADTGFDIFTDATGTGNTAFLATNANTTSTGAEFFTVDLATGAATAAGDFGTLAVTDIAVQPLPDTVPPTVVSVNRAAGSANPTIGNSVNFSVTFSEPVIGVNAADFVVASTGTINGASVSAVTGASAVTGGGTTYTVTVSGFSGNGTVGLNVVDDDSVLDTGANPLAGAGNNGGFTGQTFSVVPAGPMAYAVSGTNLYAFNTATPNSATLVGAIGFAPEGIDFNPSTGALFAIDVNGATTQLYTLNLSSGAATPVGSGFPSAGTNGSNSYDLTGQALGFDFNPKTVQADGSIRIRVTAQNGSDLRLNASTGGLAAVDGRLSLTAGGAPVSVVGSAYTNNLAQQGGSTTLLDVSDTNDTLYAQTPPNDGILVARGALGIDAKVDSGFDIFTDATGTGNTAFLATDSDGAAPTEFFTVDISTGAATAAGNFGNLSISDIAVQPLAADTNDAPTLDKPADVQVNEDAGVQTVNLTGITSGPANENAQTLSVTATSDNPALIANPTVTYTTPNTSGTLTFSSAPNASGTATITVTVADNGTTGGTTDPKTTTQTFLVTVQAVNDAPVVTSVTITPRRPVTYTVLTATPVATDVEGDTLTFSYVWRKNGVVIPNETDATLDLSKPGNGDERDRITVTVTASDGTDNSNPLTSASVTVFNFAPTIVSVSPQGATDKVGNKRTFVLTASDANGASDLTQLSLLINERLDVSSGAFLRYDIASGLLSIQRGDAFLPGIKIGAAAGANDVLDNGALRIQGSEVSLVASSDGLSLTMSIGATVRAGLVGQNTLFGRAQDVAGAFSAPRDGGFVRSGAYTVQSQFMGTTNRVPTLSGLSPRTTNTNLPSSGIASPQTFIFSARDEDGSADLDSLQFLAGRTRTGAGVANFVFFPRTRRLFLRSDNGRTLLGGMQIGTAGILENSQVRLDVSKALFLISSDNKTFGLRLPIQAKTGLVGQNKVWLRAQDRSGALAAGGDALGYVLSGSWNVTAPNASPSSPSGGDS